MRAIWLAVLRRKQFGRYARGLWHEVTQRNAVIQTPGRNIRCRSSGECDEMAFHPGCDPYAGMDPTGDSGQMLIVDTGWS